MYQIHIPGGKNYLHHLSVDYKIYLTFKTHLKDQA